jgi:hypothetical protein
LLPPEGTFPAPSETNIIDSFILNRVPTTGTLLATIPYPGIDSSGLCDILAILHDFGSEVDMTRALDQLEHEEPSRFVALWRLAVYGYYSQPETIAAIQRDLAPAYHGAPLPLGYAHAIAPWDPADPLQRPTQPHGSYTRTDEVRRVDLRQLDLHEGGHS